MEIAIKISDWLSIIAIFIAFIIGILHRDNKALHPIQFYIIVSLIVNLFLEIIEIIPKFDPIGKIASAVSNIYTLIEISTLYYFIIGIIKGKTFRFLVIIFLILFFLICIVIWTGKYDALFFIVPQLFGIESFFITIASLFYVYEVLKSKLTIDLKSDANFTVICGILFYFSIMTPLFFSYFIWANIAPELNRVVRILNMLFYTLLFISLMKAYLCPFQKQKPSQFFAS
jgi:hypothetical protein